MAIRKVYIGSVGPFLYDDAVPINDPDGDFAGEDVKSIVTNGQMLVERVPTDPYHVLRLTDIPTIGLDVNFSDVTGARVLGGVYQNNAITMRIVQISVRLRV